MNFFVQISGYFNIASGVLLFLFWYLYAILMPYSQLENTLSLLVLNKNWIFVNLVGSLGALLGAVGLVGLFFSMQDQISKMATWGFVIALIGTILMFITLVRDTLIWPILAQHDPSLLDFSGPIYASKTFFPFFIFSGVVYTIGYVIFGLSIVKSDLYPVWAGHLFAWGALMFGLGAAFGNLQVYIRSAGISGLSTGLIWLGFLMRSIFK